MLGLFSGPTRLLLGLRGPPPKSVDGANRRCGANRRVPSRGARARPNATNRRARLLAAYKYPFRHVPACPTRSSTLSVPPCAAAAAMSDDEPYDADGDVGRFLHCPSPEAPLLFPLSEPEATPPAGHFQDAPTADEQVHGNNPAAPPPALPAPAEQVQDHPTIDDAEQHQTPVMDHQAAAGMDVEQYQGMAMDVQPMHMLAPEVQRGYGFQDPTLVQGDNGVDAEHYEAPIMAAAEHYQAAPAINSEDHQAQAMDVEPQYQAMAMDGVRVQQATHVLAGAETQQALGAFPDPTPPPMQQGGGVGAWAPWLPGESMYPPPSPSLLQKLQELAAMLDDLEAGGSGSAAAAGAEADALCPGEEDVAFRPIVRGQLDCSRCRTVREVVTLNGKA